MRERYLRALSFAIFATIGLVVGGFVIGYGAALLSLPSPAPVVLPTLAATPQSTPGTAMPFPGIESTAQPAVPTSVSTNVGEPAGDGLQLSLESLDVNTAIGGVEVVILLHNGTGQDVNFSFRPEADLELTDNLGRRYDLRWAEYDGVVKAPAGGSIRLVRAFFDGVPGEDAGNLVVAAKHPPQLPEHSWNISLGQ